MDQILSIVYNRPTKNRSTHELACGIEKTCENCVAKLPESTFEKLCRKCGRSSPSYRNSPAASGARKLCKKPTRARPLVPAAATFGHSRARGSDGEATGTTQGSTS